MVSKIDLPDLIKPIMEKGENHISYSSVMSFMTRLLFGFIIIYHGMFYLNLEMRASLLGQYGYPYQTKLLRDQLYCLNLTC